MTRLDKLVITFGKPVITLDKIRQPSLILDKSVIASHKIRQADYNIR